MFFFDEKFVFFMAFVTPWVGDEESKLFWMSEIWVGFYTPYKVS